MGAAQIQLIPIGELAPGQVSAIRNEVVNGVIALATKQLGITSDKLVVRDIRAKSDLDYTYEDWKEQTGSTADTYETMSTGTVGDERWVAIYGVKDDSETPSCSAIKFNVGGGDKAIWQLQALNEQDGMVGICPGAVIIPPNTIYTISRYVRSALAGTRLVLKGVVVEKRGLVVSP